jgi:shikimate kinase
MGHVFLIGFMGAGKSTVAALVADHLGRPFVDLDRDIEAIAGRAVAAIFAEDGETAFRQLERQALLALATTSDSIVACGGGVVTRDENRATLKALGQVVYLRVTAEETLARVGADPGRPLLAGGGGLLAATALLDARECLYSAIADEVLDTVGLAPDAVADRVVAFVREEGAS